MVVASVSPIGVAIIVIVVIALIIGALRGKLRFRNQMPPL